MDTFKPQVMSCEYSAQFWLGENLRRDTMFLSRLKNRSACTVSLVFHCIRMRHSWGGRHPSNDGLCADGMLLA